MKRSLIIGLPIGLAMACNAIAAITFLDYFESYAVGSDIAGQNSWQGWDSNPAAGALVSDTYAYSGTQSVNISGASDLVRTFSGRTSGSWSFRIQQYVPSTLQGDSYFLLLDQYQDQGPYDWAVQINTDITNGVVHSEFANHATVPLVTDAWVELRCDINLDANTVTEYYNNQLLGTHQWSSEVNGIEAVDLYGNSSTPVYYDNLLITEIPEPGVTGMIALAGLGFIRRRRA